MKNVVEKASRRTFLRRSTLWIAMAPVLVVAGTANANKADKSDFSYRDQPSAKGQLCGNCTAFMTPNHCRIVDGEISPAGWCVAYSSR